MARSKAAFAPEAFRHLQKSDKVMAALVRRIGPPTLKLETMREPYATLLQSIVYQQLTGKAAATILKRLCNHFGSEEIPRPEQILGSEHEQLRGVGLSNAKAAAVLDLARKHSEGVIPSFRKLAAMDDEDIIQCLTKVRGIGRWSVEMLLLFRMGRQDVWPVHDYGVRKGYARTYGLTELPSPRTLGELGEKWRPYRSAAAWYFWRALDPS